MDQQAHQALMRAEVLMDLSRLSEAEQLLRDALVQDPGDALILTALARVRYLQDRHDEAAELARQAMVDDPDHVAAHVVLCDVLVATDDARAAVQEAQVVMRLAPHAWTSPYCMARALLAGRLPRVREALDWAIRSVDLGPHVPATHTMVGICLERLGFHEGAEQAYRRALSIDPTDSHAQGCLGSLLLERGDLRGGAAALTNAVTQDPGRRGLKETLDVTLFLLARRVLLAFAGGAVLLGLELSDSAPHWVRSLTGLVLAATVWWLVRGVLRSLPRGAHLWGRGAVRRLGWPAILVTGLLVLVGTCLLFLAFAPHVLALAAGEFLLGALRWVSIVAVVVWVMGAAVSLVRGT